MNFKTNKRKFVARVMLFILIVSIFAMMGCSNQTDITKGLRKGFSGSDFSDESNACLIAYESDNNEFDITDVTLTFYYGFVLASGIELELSGQSYPVYELYFENEEGVSVLVKHVEENLISEKYECKVIFDDNYHIIEILYNHSETLTIPQELFTKETGIIHFCIYSENIREFDSKFRLINSIEIYYKKEKNNIILSSKPIWSV